MNEAAVLDKLFTKLVEEVAARESTLHKLKHGHRMSVRALADSIRKPKAFGELVTLCHDLDRRVQKLDWVISEEVKSRPRPSTIPVLCQKYGL